MRHLPPKPILGLLIVVAVFHQFRRGYFKDFKKYFLSLNAKNYAVKFLIVAALAFGLMFFDPFLVSVIHQWDEKFPFLTAAGEILNRNSDFWMLLVVLYFLGFFLNRKFSAAAFGMLFSTALTGMIVNSLKFVFVRARPYSYFGPFSFFNFENARKHAFQSMPSGDVALIAGAFAYLFYFFEDYSLRFLLFLLPLTSAFARISTDKHWPSDTLVSMGIALIVAGFIRNYEKSWRSPC